MQKFESWRAFGIVAVFCLATVLVSQAQTFKTLLSFSNDIHGATPVGALVQGTDGDLYGTTSGGGVGICFGQPGCGTIFKVTPSGVLTTIYTFCAQYNCSDGQYPQAGLTLFSGGNLYGTTSYGGAQQAGSVFKVTPTGKLSVLYSFCSFQNCPDGEGPDSPVIEGADGNIYGTTPYAGPCIPCGTVFKVTLQGALTTLHQFCTTDCADGERPYAGLIQGSSGVFYGTNFYGGNSTDPNCPGGCGEVFQINAAGVFRTVYSFCSQTGCSDGEYSTAGVVQGSDGSLYGTTLQGGANGWGTIFKLTPSGVLTTLHSFCSQANCVDGSSPNAGLILANDGNFYGTTTTGGNSSGKISYGTVFRITPAGEFATLHRFTNTDGATPYAGLFQGTDGVLYGTTEYGGAFGDGTVYRLALGLGPFVQAVPQAGKVGRVITILGNNLATTTSVTFNGLPSTFQVISNSYLKAQVPAGATTGTITVTTASGTLSSNVPFRVLP